MSLQGNGKSPLSSPIEQQTSDAFADAAITRDPHPTIKHRSGLAAYQESLIGGEFAGRGSNGLGLTKPEDVRTDATKHPTPQAFWVEAIGQLLLPDLLHIASTLGIGLVLRRGAGSFRPS